MANVSGIMVSEEQPKLLSPADLLRDAWRHVRETSPPAAMVWAAYAVFHIVVQVFAATAGLPVSTPGLTPGYLTMQVVLTIAGSVAAALTLRLMLRGRDGWLRPDRPFLEGLGLLAGGQFAIILLIAAMLGTGLGAENNGAVLRPLIGAAAYLAIAYLLIKLMLWPLARIDGRADIGPREAWRLMRRTGRSYLVCLLLLSLPFGLLTFIANMLMHVNFAQTPRLYVVLVAAGSGIVAMVLQGVAVAVYERRIETRTRLADTFD